MKKKRLNKLLGIRLIVAFIVLCTATVAEAHGCFLSEAECNVTVISEETVTLGHDDPAAGKKVCYTWSGNYLIGNRNEPTCTFKAPKTPGTYSVSVTRIGEYVCTESITITVVTDVYIVEVAPNKPCWNHRDDLVTSDFTIITEPANMERFVKITEEKAINNDDGIADVCIEFYTDVPGIQEHHYKYCDIEVVNSNVTQGVSLSPDVEHFINLLNNRKDAYNKAVKCIEEVSDGVNFLAPKTIEIEKPSGSIEFSVIFAKYYCCSKIAQGFTLSASGSFSVGAEIRVPVNKLSCLYPPLITVPPIFVIVGNLSVGLSVDRSLDISQCMLEQSGLCVSFGVSLTGSAGVGIRMQGDFIRATVGFFARGSGSISLCIGQLMPLQLLPNLGGSAKFDVGFLVEGQLKSLVSVKYEYVIKSFGF